MFVLLVYEFILLATFLLFIKKTKNIRGLQLSKFRQNAVRFVYEIVSFSSELRKRPENPRSLTYRSANFG